MPGSIPAVRRHLIDAIAAQVRASRGSTPVPALPFVRDYYRGVDEDDLREHPAAALAAAALDHLRFGARRRAGQPLVRVFNPTHDGNGWTADQSVVEVVTDDMPFLVDSLAMVLNDCGISLSMMVHPVLHVRRDRGGRMQRCGSEPAEGTRAESWQHIAIDRVTDPLRLEDVRRRILATLSDVELAVRDWPRMKARAAELARSVGDGLPGIGRAECVEAGAFLAWLADNHFTFLGYREYRLARGASTDRLAPVAGSGLGLMRTGRGRPRPQTAALRGEARRRAREATALVVTKANSVSTVHRATYLDYIGVKTFDARGNVNGECRFIGLFTSSTYSASTREIPLLRNKVRQVIDHIGAAPVSHDRSSRRPGRQGEGPRTRDSDWRAGAGGERPPDRRRGRGAEDGGEAGVPDHLEGGPRRRRARDAGREGSEGLCRFLRVGEAGIAHRVRQPRHLRRKIHPAGAAH